MDWSDGQLDGSAAFVAFADAYGGVRGRAQHPHIYLLPGDYTIGLTIVDDYAGSVSAMTPISMLAPEDALFAHARPGVPRRAADPDGRPCRSESGSRL